MPPRPTSRLKPKQLIPNKHRSPLFQSGLLLFPHPCKPSQSISTALRAETHGRCHTHGGRRQTKKKPLLRHPSSPTFQQACFQPPKALLSAANRYAFAMQKDCRCNAKGLLSQNQRTAVANNGTLRLVAFAINKRTVQVFQQRMVPVFL